MTPYDLTKEVDIAKGDVVPFSLSPANWAKFTAPTFTTGGKWRTVTFDPRSATAIPPRTRGVYTFVICPRICDHPSNAFVAYVGKADRTPLRERFRGYLQEQKKIKRGHISYLLSKYKDYLQFCFLEVRSPHPIATLENSLIVALDPPFNDAQPAEVTLVRKALR